MKEKEVDVNMMTEQDFKDSISIYKLMGILDLNFNEEYMYTILKEGDEPTICVNEETTSLLNDDVFYIMMNHEYAHAIGIIDEEEADLFALEYLSKTQKELLIEQWEDRHAHKYEHTKT